MARNGDHPVNFLHSKASVVTPRGEYAAGGAPKKWIKGAIRHPGALHRDLGVPQGEKIPAKKLAAATHSDNPTIRKRAALAKTLKGMHK